MNSRPTNSGQQSPTTPELTASETPAFTRTNTLVITSLPPSFFEPLVLEALRIHFESYGDVHTWAPLKAFARIFLIYYDEEAAELAKETCDNLYVEEMEGRYVVGSSHFSLRVSHSSQSPATLLRVFRADPTPLDQLDNPDLLRPPALEKNFLISPPGSPPVGWEQIREEPPNNTPLADDLIVALRKLQIQRESQGHGAVAVLIEPQEGVGISICVEDCSGDDLPAAQEEPVERWARGLGGSSGLKSQFKPVPTALPPVPIAS